MNKTNIFIPPTTSFLSPSFSPLFKKINMSNTEIKTSTQSNIGYQRLGYGSYNPFFRIDENSSRANKMSKITSTTIKNPIVRCYYDYKGIILIIDNKGFMYEFNIYTDKIEQIAQLCRKTVYCIELDGIKCKGVALIYDSKTEKVENAFMRVNRFGKPKRYELSSQPSCIAINENANEFYIGFVNGTVAVYDFTTFAYQLVVSVSNNPINSIKVHAGNRSVKVNSLNVIYNIDFESLEVDDFYIGYVRIASPKCASFDADSNNWYATISPDEGKTRHKFLAVKNGSYDSDYGSIIDNDVAIITTKSHCSSIILWHNMINRITFVNGVSHLNIDLEDVKDATYVDHIHYNILVIAKRSYLQVYTTETLAVRHCSTIAVLTGSMPNDCPINRSYFNNTLFDINTIKEFIDYL